MGCVNSGVHGARFAQLDSIWPSGYNFADTKKQPWSKRRNP
jgi:hypothetical protein